MNGTTINRSTSITAGGTSQTLMPPASGRKYFYFHNISDTAMTVNETADADADNSWPVAAGGKLEFAGPFVPVGLMTVLCATTGKKFVAKEA